MERKQALFLVLIATLVLLITACGGSQTSPPPTGTQPAVTPGEFPGLPMQPLAPREAAVADGLVFDGDSCVAFNNGLLAGGMAMLESLEGSPSFGWALYQIPEPVDPPYCLTVEVEYIDDDPYAATDRDGYWIAYGNFDLDRWVFNGPYTQYRTRLFFEPGMDVVSPGGDVTVVVFCENGNRANVEKLQVGTDAGPGYEEVQLGLPSGAFVGRGADMQVDLDGNPHVVYGVEKAIMGGSDTISQLRYAWSDGMQWFREDIDTFGIDGISWVQLALGSGSRRAMLIKDHGTTDDLYLFYDDGGGSLVNAGVVAVAPPDASYAGLTFINSADDPAGDLDLLLITYTLPAISPDVQTHYRTYDGAAFSLEQILMPLATRQCGRICVTTGPDRNGVAGVPEEVANEWFYHIGLYSAVADTWDFATIPNWPVPESPEWDSWSLNYFPDFMVRQVPGGDIVAAYIVDDEEAYRFGRFNGVDWLSTEADRIPVLDGLMDSGMDMDVFSTGQGVILTAFGAASPELMFGFVGTGDPWFRSYLNHDPWTMLQGSLAVDAANNVHIAVINFMAGTFDYYRRDTVTHDITREVIDNGGGDKGMVYGYVHAAMVDNRLHLFYVDGATHRLLHAVNQGGIWLSENEPIETGGGDWPIYVMGAGYLEERNQLYVVYLDYISFSMKIAYSTLGTGEWSAKHFASGLFEIAAVADNESEVGLVGITVGIGDESLVFSCGAPEDSPHEKEYVSFSSNHIDYPFFLDFNPLIEQWCLVCTNDDEDRVNYFLRSPMGSWVGPFTVAAQPGGDMETGGIDFNHADGTVRIILMQQPPADPVRQIWVYSAPDGSAVFTPTQQLMSIDTTTHDFGYLLAAPRTNGEPLIGVVHKPVADTTWDIRFFQPDAPDSWASIGMWSSELMSTQYAMILDAANRIICCGIEMEEIAPGFGHLTVRYPW